MKQLNIMGGEDHYHYIDDVMKITKRSNNMASYWIMPSFSTKIDIQGLKIEIIAKRVCKHFNVSIEDLKRPKGKHNVREARNIIYYILHVDMLIPCVDVAKLMSRTHATILSGSRRVKGFMETDKEYRNLVNYLRS